MGRRLKRPCKAVTRRSQLRINRSPVLNLWVAVVANREGYSFEEGLSFASAISSIYGRARARAIGRIKAKKKPPRNEAKLKKFKKYRVFGTRIPGKIVKGRIVALSGGKEMSSKKNGRYIERAFGPYFKTVKGSV